MAPGQLDKTRVLAVSALGLLAWASYLINDVQRLKTSNPEIFRGPPEPTFEEKPWQPPPKRVPRRRCGALGEHASNLC